jgi:CheY-like chemotaxis protein
MTVLRDLPPVDARVLVVDDDFDLLDALCEVLSDAGYEVVSASNGFEALQILTEQPLPDLIVLDLMMPIMDGHSFRQVQLADPRLAAIPTVALSAGTIDLRIMELEPADWMPKPVSVAALLASVERHRLRRAVEAPVTPNPGGHSMQFYASDETLAAGVAGFLAPAIQAGDGAIVVATPAHRVLFADHLAAAGVDPLAAQARGDLHLLDARATLDVFLIDGRIAEPLFNRVIGPVVARVERPGRRFRAYGEMVDLLWQDGRIATAVSLEQCWNRLLATVPVDLHCAYAAPINELQRTSAAWIEQQHAAA